MEKRLLKPLFFAGPRPSRRHGRIAAGAFHDQDVDLPPVRLGLGKNRRLGDRLIIEIHVAGVKQGSSLRSQQDSGRPKHMASIEELEARFARIRGHPLARKRVSLSERARLPMLGHPIGLPMGEQRIESRRPGIHIFALPCHHIDRVMKEDVADLRGRISHEHAGLRLAPHHYR